MNDKQIEKAIKCFIDEMNKQMEGKIHVDEFGGRWIFRNGRWCAMCYVDPISFEGKLRDNPMPTRTITDEMEDKE